MQELSDFDILFLSYDEPDAKENLDRLLNRGIKIKIAPKTKGIKNALQACAELATTEHFFLVDGDNEVLHDFHFTISEKHFNKNAVHVWRAMNPVNSLVYGYGAIKLFPRSTLLNSNTHLDQTTGSSHCYKIIDKIASITRFNSNELTTWRSAFRECAKLASSSIKNTNQSESDVRLKTWCTVSNKVPFASYCLEGANAGKKFGLENSQNIKELSKINDFEWLTQQFRDYYKIPDGIF